MTEVQGKNEVLKITLKQDAKINPGKIPELIEEYQGKLQFNIKGTPFFLYRYKKCGVVEKDAELLLQLTEELLQAMDILLGDLGKTT